MSSVEERSPPSLLPPIRVIETPEPTGSFLETMMMKVHESSPPPTRMASSSRDSSPVTDRRRLSVVAGCPNSPPGQRSTLTSPRNSSQSLKSPMKKTVERNTSPVSLLVQKSSF